MIATSALSMDNNASDILVKGNIVAGAAPDTAGNPPGPPVYGKFDDVFYFCMFGQGSNEKINVMGNIFDMGLTGHIIFLNSSTGSGNNFSSNIILSNYSGDPYSPSFGSWCRSYSHGMTTPSSPACAANVYHNYGGGTTYTTGHGKGAPVVSDSNPQIIDPKISGWTYNVDPTSPVFAPPVNFPTLPANWGEPGFWGPRGFIISSIGTASVPSCPH
jgi:hypothetical protein